MVLENDFSTSPMGGESVPYQDISPAQESQDNSSGKAVSVKQKTNKTLLLVVIGLGFVILIILIILIYVLQVINKKPQTTLIPQNTPIVTSVPKVATNSANFVTLQERVDKLQQQLNNLDLQQSELSYPQLDWDIKY